MEEDGRSTWWPRPQPLKGEMLASNVDLLSDLDRIVDLDPKIANSALDLRMSEQ